MMQTKDFDYLLPESAIAQQPATPRDSARLMIMSRTSGATQHARIDALPRWLRSGDVLVFNDTKVMPARLIGHKIPTGGRAELQLIDRISLDTWDCLARPGRRLKPGAHIDFGQGRLTGKIADYADEGMRRVVFSWGEGTFEDALAAVGRLPLPPYIKEEVRDEGRYQTIYARESGAKAAPTAGLHFTERLLGAIRSLGVSIVFVTLHVGLGTFRPVQTEAVADHTMHAEPYEISSDAAAAIEAARSAGRRIIAVGTTTARALEHAARADGTMEHGSGSADIFIYPGYSFRVIDGLLTNFHLPRSSLLMMVSAFAGREQVLRAYEEAVLHGYRFFSFGDAMLIS